MHRQAPPRCAFQDHTNLVCCCQPRYAPAWPPHQAMTPSWRCIRGNGGESRREHRGGLAHATRSNECSQACPNRHAAQWLGHSPCSMSWCPTLPSASLPMLSSEPPCAQDLLYALLDLTMCICAAEPLCMPKSLCSLMAGPRPLQCIAAPDPSLHQSANIFRQTHPCTGLTDNTHALLNPCIHRRCEVQVEAAHEVQNGHGVRCRMGAVQWAMQ
jgi:hypothetical protein